jgi:hypothetical protein
VVGGRFPHPAPGTVLRQQQQVGAGQQQQHHAPHQVHWRAHQFCALQQGRNSDIFYYNDSSLACLEEGYGAASFWYGPGSDPISYG